MAAANGYICQLPGKPDRVEITAVDWQGIRQTVREKGRIVGMWDTVALLQTGKNTFTVCYGLEIRRDFTYDTASSLLGQCLMHVCACEGRVAE